MTDKQWQKKVDTINPTPEKEIATTGQVNKVSLLRDVLNARFLERSDVIDGMLTSLISGEPLILIGSPGTAKSALCQAVCQALQGEATELKAELDKLTKLIQKKLVA